MRIVLGVFCFLWFTGCQSQPNRLPVPSEVLRQGNTTLEIYTFDEFKHWMSKHDDTLYVINFWATWCRPCVEELPFFEQLNDSLANKPAKLMLVSLDSRKKAETELIPFIQRKQLKSKVIHLNAPDFNNWLDKVSPDWSGSIPATLMVKNGQKTFFEQSFEFEPLWYQVKSKL
jgi:thiol-disulfide isomerase/thioredoxin